MINFFLLAWDPTNVAQVEATKQVIAKAETHKNDFEVVFKGDHSIVYAQAPTPQNVFVLSNNSGIILGRLYHKIDSFDVSPATDSALIKDTAKILGSCGDYLTERYWGSYVTIIPTLDKGLLVGRDCSGLQLCYTTWLSGVFCAFSNLDALPFLNDIRKEINLGYLTKLAVHAQSPFIETGLKHVQQIAAGQYAQISLQTSKILKLRSWKPENFTECLIEDYDTAKEALYNTVLSSIAAQSRDYENLGLMLSGGLDSSILLACLRKMHNAEEIHATHLDSQENDLSEAQYAKAMAEAYGIELEIEKITAGANTNYIGNITPPWPIPVDRDQLKDTDENVAAMNKEKQFIEARNIQAFFKGQGGDQIFFKRPELAPLLDYKKKHVVDSKYYEILMNTARLTQMSVWKLLKIARKNDVSAIPAQRIKNIFLAKTFLEAEHPESIFVDHPWFEGENDFSFGKHNQLMQYTFFNHYAQRYTPSTPQTPNFTPFICQPLMETMLRIPTYFLLANGRNRGLAREAFKAELVPKVYNREHKGYATKVFFNGLIENLTAIKEFLYDGILLSEGFLDKAALDANLNEDSIKTKLIGGDIMNSLKYEKWARSLI